MNSFKVKSYIPGTEERRLWKGVTGWLKEADAYLQENIPNFPPFPMDSVIRSPLVLYSALDAMVDTLERVRAYAQEWEEGFEKFRRELEEYGQ